MIECICKKDYWDFAIKFDHTFYCFQCKKHFTTIMEDLNNKCLFRNYPIFSSIKWRCLLLCVLSTSFSCIWVASFLLSATYGSILKDKTYWVMNFIIGLPIVCSICPCGLLIIYGCRRMVTLLSSFSFVSPFLSKSICVFGFFFAFSVFFTSYFSIVINDATLYWSVLQVSTLWF